MTPNIFAGVFFISAKLRQSGMGRKKNTQTDAGGSNERTNDRKKKLKSLHKEKLRVEKKARETEMEKVKRTGQHETASGLPGVERLASQSIGGTYVALMPIARDSDNLAMPTRRAAATAITFITGHLSPGSSRPFNPY